MFAANVDVVVNGVLGQVGAVDILLEALVAFLSRGWVGDADSKFSWGPNPKKQEI